MDRMTPELLAEIRAWAGTAEDWFRPGAYYARQLLAELDAVTRERDVALKKIADREAAWRRLAEIPDDYE